MDSTRFRLKFREGMAFSLSSQIELNLRATRMPVIWKYLHRSSSESRFLSKASLNTPMPESAMITLSSSGRGYMGTGLFVPRPRTWHQSEFFVEKTEISIPTQKPLSQTAEDYLRHFPEPVGSQSREISTSNSNGRSLCTRETTGRRSFQNTSRIY